MTSCALHRSTITNCDLAIIPAQAGIVFYSIRFRPRYARNYFFNWIPACAGMTKEKGM